MPEGVEIELYRRTADQAVGRRIASVDTPDEWYLKEGTSPDEVAAACVGAEVIATRRIGKLLLLDLSSGHVLGLRFGMTGRLIVDGTASIEYLEYSSTRDDPAWDRFVIHFADEGSLRIRDPRRLGGVVIDPDESRLGADAFTIDAERLRARVLVGDVALKARLLDQQRIAGIGNLIADETLWRARLDPARPARSLDDVEAERLLATLHEVLGDFVRDGGSHTGVLMSARARGAHCPRCGTELDRRTIGGRTTFSCPREQV
ncbi:MAG: DNA-formamidopyrimidine glycosylase family protein [Acidimicrobiales bacterium]